MAAELPFDAPRLLGALQRHGVSFVLIGGVAAIAQGSPLPTVDVDVTPERSPDNVDRLVQALVELDAKLRTPSEPVPFPIDPKMLAAADSWTLVTSAGDLDLIFVPAGTRGYADLARSARAVDLGTGAPVLIASLLDIVRMKEASARPKDLAQIPALRQTLEVVREREARGEPS